MLRKAIERLGGPQIVLIWGWFLSPRGSGMTSQPGVAKASRRRYVKAPILEAVCEFRLSPDSKWDLTIPGLLYEKLSSEFPNKEQRILQDIEITQAAQGMQQQIRSSERILFLSPDRKTFVQVGPQLLSVNRLRPYISWEQFKPAIQIAFQSLSNTIDVPRIQRIGLRYINRIEIPQKNFLLETFFDLYPYLGKGLPQGHANFFVGCTFEFRNRQDLCKVQLTDTVPEAKDASAFILDIDYFLGEPNSVRKYHRSVKTVVPAGGLMAPTTSTSATLSSAEETELARRWAHEDIWTRQTVGSFRQLTPLAHYSIMAPYGSLLRDAHSGYIVLFERTDGSRASVTLEIERAFASLRLYRVELPAVTEVRDYLLRFPRLGISVPSITRNVREKLGPKTEISLEVYTDPEIQDEYLVLYARRSEYNPEFLQALSELGSQCADLIPLDSGWLVITTDFRPLPE